MYYVSRQYLMILHSYLLTLFTERCNTTKLHSVFLTIKSSLDLILPNQSTSHLGAYEKGSKKKILVFDSCRKLILITSCTTCTLQYKTKESKHIFGAVQNIISFLFCFSIDFFNS